MTEALEVLLELQGLDLAGDRLRHQRATLSERAALASAQRRTVELDGSLERVGAELADLGRRQRRLEADVAAVEEKAVKDNTTLYSGSVTAPRELQALSAEIEALGRRARSLEDDVLVIMEATEPLAAERAKLAAEHESVGEDAERLAAAVADHEAAIDAELHEVVGAREALAPQVAAPLLADYEKLRSRLGGVGVARLDANRCTGCHLTVSAMELDALRHAAAGAAAVHHEECGRILVLTPGPLFVR